MDKIFLGVIFVISALFLTGAILIPASTLAKVVPGNKAISDPRLVYLNSDVITGVTFYQSVQSDEIDLVGGTETQTTVTVQDSITGNQMVITQDDFNSETKVSIFNYETGTSRSVDFVEMLSSLRLYHSDAAIQATKEYREGRWILTNFTFSAHIR
jgi:hypothetical protein